MNPEFTRVEHFTMAEKLLARAENKAGELAADRAIYATAALAHATLAAVACTVNTPEAQR